MVINFGAVLIMAVVVMKWLNSSRYAIPPEHGQRLERMAKGELGAFSLDFHSLVVLASVSVVM